MSEKKEPKRWVTVAGKHFPIYEDENGNEVFGVGEMSREEKIKGTPLIYATAIIRGNRIIIDGYSNKKTEKGALEDLAKAVEKYSEAEAKGIRDSIKFGEMEQFKDDNYGIEWEPVSHAVKPGKDGEDEYKDAKWYLHTYFWK